MSERLWNAEELVAQLRAGGTAAVARRPPPSMARYRGTLQALARQLCALVEPGVRPDPSEPERLPMPCSLELALPVQQALMLEWLRREVDAQLEFERWRGKLLAIVRGRAALLSVAPQATHMGLWFDDLPDGDYQGVIGCGLGGRVPYAYWLDRHELFQRARQSLQCNEFCEGELGSCDAGQLSALVVVPAGIADPATRWVQRSGGRIDAFAQRLSTRLAVPTHSSVRLA